PTINPNGLGNEVTEYVVFEPWAQTVTPTPHFITPLEGFLYLNLVDKIELKIPFITTFIIGKSTVEIYTPRCLYGIDYVEFYIDDEPRYVDNTDPYSWEWDEKTQLYMYWIEAIAYDTQGNRGSVRMKSWKVQMRSN
ncbi:MAG: hypothetical protein KKC68_02060, partial [Candidatus Thermoplasmatota archaeon]|nr:hypothetical protein [Candidatus Thermoplasmatota archaeon]MBU1940534.1 hypothetical protein [Candidatus Thermoplasmatota archaeon]